MFYPVHVLEADVSRLTGLLSVLVLVVHLIKHLFIIVLHFLAFAFGEIQIKITHARNYHIPPPPTR